MDDAEVNAPLTFIAHKFSSLDCNCNGGAVLVHLMVHGATTYIE